MDDLLDESFMIMDENLDIDRALEDKRVALARKLEMFEVRQRVASRWERQLKEREAKLNEREQMLALREHNVQRSEEALKAESVRARRDKEELKKTVVELQNEKGLGARRLTEEPEEERMKLLDVAMEVVRKEREAEFRSKQEAERQAFEDARSAVEEILMRQGQERSQFWGLRKRKADDVE
ncbi:hypothetical protein N0V85_009524 [Neurospora sp. IMI 360204]|nr:hypothetical protein N0V85_009524 [Neurospora sp. IMI 360204]